MTSFNQLLQNFSGFTSQQQSKNTSVEAAQDCINRLLDNDKLMRPSNRYDLAQRRAIAKTVLAAQLFDIAMDQPDSDVIEKLKELNGLVESGIANPD